MANTSAQLQTTMHASEYAGAGAGRRLFRIPEGRATGLSVAA